MCGIVALRSPIPTFYDRGATHRLAILGSTLGMGQNEVPSKVNLCFKTHSKIMSFEENKVLVYICG